MRLESIVLEGPSLQLTPLTPGCLGALAAAALSDPAIWQHIPYRVRDERDVEALLRRALVLEAQASAITFATRLQSSGEIVGGTSIVLVDGSVPSVEIGGTWIVPRWQRTHVNTEAKLLQLTHCFDALDCRRVELKTDIRNLRSRAAIARIGGTQEGILRAHKLRADGSLRDSVLFSILASEWPAVRDALQAKLAPRVKLTA
jgi:N-acetyltransferase